MNHHHRRLLLMAMTIVLATPLLLFAWGVRGVPIENRDPTPRPGFDPGDQLDTEFYSSLGDYSIDVMPLRPALVQADAEVDLAMWRESPNPDVAIGVDGWLFLVESWQLGCQPEADATGPTKQLIDIIGVLEASGRDAVLTVAPNKATAYPEKLGPSAEQAACLEPGRASAQAQLARAGSDYINLFAIVAEERDRVADDSLYYPDDTHWKPTLTMTAARLLINHFDPELWDPTVIEESSETRTGDLARLVGQLEPTTHEKLTVDRAGPDPSRLDGNDRLGPNDWRAGTSDPVLPGRSVVIHDSFLAPAEPWLVAYLERSRFVDWTRADELVTEDEPWLIEQLVDADRVILQLVERNLLGRYATVDAYPLPVTPEALVVALRHDLVAYRRPAALAFSADEGFDGGPDPVNVVEPVVDGTTYVVVDGVAHSIIEPVAVSARAEIYDIPRSD